MDPRGHFCKGGIQMDSQFLSELLGAAGIAIIVSFAPLQVYLMDRACGNATPADFAIWPGAHTFLEEGNNGAVGSLILFSGKEYGLWL